MIEMIADAAFALSVGLRGPRLVVTRDGDGFATASFGAAEYERLLRLLRLGDMTALEPALIAAKRRGGRPVQLQLLATFDRLGVARAVPDVPKTFEPIEYLGVRLCWDRETATLFSASVAEHVLPVFERAYPTDSRPRAAISAAREFVRTNSPGDLILFEGVENAARAAWSASLGVGQRDRGAWYAARTAARSAFSAVGRYDEQIAWATADDALHAAAWGAAHDDWTLWTLYTPSKEAEEARQHELLVRYLLCEVSQ